MKNKLSISKENEWYRLSCSPMSFTQKDANEIFSWLREQASGESEVEIDYCKNIEDSVIKTYAIDKFTFFSTENINTLKVRFMDKKIEATFKMFWC